MGKAARQTQSRKSKDKSKIFPGLFILQKITISVKLTGAEGHCGSLTEYVALLRMQRGRVRCVGLKVQKCVLGQAGRYAQLLRVRTFYSQEESVTSNLSSGS